MIEIKSCRACGHEHTRREDKKFPKICNYCNARDWQLPYKRIKKPKSKPCSSWKIEENTKIPEGCGKRKN